MRFFTVVASFAFMLVGQPYSTATPITCNDPACWSALMCWNPETGPVIGPYHVQNPCWQSERDPNQPCMFYNEDTGDVRFLTCDTAPPVQ